MSTRTNVFLIVSGLVFFSLFSAACVSTTFGEAAYSGGGLTLPVSHTGEPSEGYVQVTVYEIKNNLQVETDVFYAPLALQQGDTTAFIPGSLEPGQYKLYIYLIQNGERKTAAIRDIVVN
ncbi:MAG: hypothetical protein EHM53_10155 [Methanoregulaceae archaeon]|nr:MAG: hypothetical protein EHM53_10155 [Methanoregulaceae archaeon]